MKEGGGSEFKYDQFYSHSFFDRFYSLKPFIVCVIASTEVLMSK